MWHASDCEPFPSSVIFTYLHYSDSRSSLFHLPDFFAMIVRCDSLCCLWCKQQQEVVNLCISIHEGISWLQIFAMMISFSRVAWQHLLWFFFFFLTVEIFTGQHGHMVVSILANHQEWLGFESIICPFCVCPGSLQVSLVLWNKCNTNQKSFNVKVP